MKKKSEKPIIVKSDNILLDICNRVNDKFKNNIIFTSDNISPNSIKTWVKTDLTLVNQFLYGGVPNGRIIECFGWESSMKTAFAELLMIAFQKAGGISVMLDIEGTWDKDRSMRMGYNPEKGLELELNNVDSVEKCFDCIYQTFDIMKEYNVPILFVWDTIGATRTDNEIKGDTFAGGMIEKPRLISQGLKKLGNELPKNLASLIFCNHVIMKPVRFAGQVPETTPGGGAIKFWSSYRINMRSTSNITFGNVNVGTYVKLKMVKCKVGPPNRVLELPFFFDQGWDDDYANLDYLIRDGATNIAKEYVTKSGAHIHIHLDDKISLYYSQLKEKIKKCDIISDFLKEGAIKEWEYVNRWKKD